jgi:hypothetical protein
VLVLLARRAAVRELLALERALVLRALVERLELRLLAAALVRLAAALVVRLAAAVVRLAVAGVRLAALVEARLVLAALVRRAGVLRAGVVVSVLVSAAALEPVPAAAVLAVPEGVLVVVAIFSLPIGGV